MTGTIYVKVNGYTLRSEYFKKKSHLKALLEIFGRQFPDCEITVMFDDVDDTTIAEITKPAII